MSPTLARLLGFSLLALAPLIPHVTAGDKIGNGGGAWTCSLPGKPIAWIRMIDIYEGRTEHHLPIQETSKEPREIADQSLIRLFSLDARLAADFRAQLDRVVEKFSLVSAELEVIDDALWRIRPYPEECAGGEIRYTQIANFKDDGSLIVRKDLWEHPEFSSVQKAAVLLHEAVYADLRAKFQEKNSIRARHLVALLLSDLAGTTLGTEIRKVLESGPKQVAPYPIRWVKIPKGTYTIGPPGQKRQYTLLQDLEIMDAKLTNHQAVSRGIDVTQASRTRRVNCPESFIVTGTTPSEKGYCANEPATLPHSDFFSPRTHPANRMNELDREGYRYRLLTPEEWEIAALAGWATLFSFGDDPSQLMKHAAVSSKQDFERTQPVDPYLFPPNRWGVHDLVGNFEEYVEAAGSDLIQRRLMLKGCSYYTTEYDWPNRCVPHGTWKLEDITEKSVRFVREKRF